jgi:hypothetical protein
MSNYFPDGRPIQRMMHALSSDANMVVISPTQITGYIIQALEADFALDPTSYPGYNADSFSKMLSEVNVMQITSEEGGYFTLGSINNKAYPPASTYGGMYIYGSETISKIYVNACQVILFIKPTP